VPLEDRRKRCTPSLSLRLCSNKTVNFSLFLLALFDVSSLSLSLPRSPWPLALRVVARTESVHRRSMLATTKGPGVKKWEVERKRNKTKTTPTDRKIMMRLFKFPTATTCVLKSRLACQCRSRCQSRSTGLPVPPSKFTATASLSGTLLTRHCHASVSSARGHTASAQVRWCQWSRGTGRTGSLKQLELETLVSAAGRRTSN
jgi:hypothetical protein